jgi:hypothetical protein
MRARRGLLCGRSAKGTIRLCDVATPLVLHFCRRANTNGCRCVLIREMPHLSLGGGCRTCDGRNLFSFLRGAFCFLSGTSRVSPESAVGPTAWRVAWRGRYGTEEARDASAVRAVAFSPSGRHLACGLRNGQLLVYAAPPAAASSFLADNTPGNSGGGCGGVGGDASWQLVAR